MLGVRQEYIITYNKWQRGKCGPEGSTEKVTSAQIPEGKGRQVNYFSENSTFSHWQKVNNLNQEDKHQWESKPIKIT